MIMSTKVEEKCSPPFAFPEFGLFFSSPHLTFSFFYTVRKELGLNTFETPRYRALNSYLLRYPVDSIIPKMATVLRVPNGINGDSSNGMTLTVLGCGKCSASTLA
jgi:hypothetical protein